MEYNAHSRWGQLGKTRNQIKKHEADIEEAEKTKEELDKKIAELKIEKENIRLTEKELNTQLEGVFPGASGGDLTTLASKVPMLRQLPKEVVESQQGNEVLEELKRTLQKMEQLREKAKADKEAKEGATGDDPMGQRPPAEKAAEEKAGGPEAQRQGVVGEALQRG